MIDDRLHTFIEDDRNGCYSRMDATKNKLLLLLPPLFSSLHTSLQEETFLVFYNLTFAPIMYMINDYSAAEDIIQEAFLKTIYHAPPIDDERQLKSWIKVTVHNLTLNYLRKMKKVRNEVDLESVYIVKENSDGCESVEKEVEVKLLEEQIMQYLMEMKPEYRLLIELRWKRQLSYKEIAEELNSTEDKVRLKLHRAREALRNKTYTKRGVQDE